MNVPTLANVMASAAPMLDPLPCALPPRTLASGGSSTSTSTITRSSTISQPTAMWPLNVSSAPRASSARRSTTVLATDRARPNTRPAPKLQPHSIAGHVRDEAARVRPDDDAGHEVTDEWRKFQSRRGEAEDHRQPETGRDGGNEIDFMWHGPPSSNAVSRLRMLVLRHTSRGILLARGAK